MLVCKYDRKKLSENAENGDSDMHGIDVVRTSIKSKHEGIGLAGPTQKEEEEEEESAEDFFQNRKV